MDGDKDVLQTEFQQCFVLVHDNDSTDKPIQKREILTRDDPNIMDWVFEYDEISHLIYCWKGHEESCKDVFKGPEANAILEIKGNAKIEYKIQQIKVIDTKGIKAVGPTLDMYPQIVTTAQIAGILTARAGISFPRYKMYFPQIPETEEYQVWSRPSPDDEKRAQEPEMKHILDANIEASATFDFHITLDVNLGIRLNCRPQVST
ncbi:hypothetical protein BDW75DRAFT_243181 [Aspergillus navahoensis]